MASLSHCAAAPSIDQSALAQSPAAAGLDLSSEIIVRTLDIGVAEYQGTRAALEAEGVIPVGIQWPDGFNNHRWEDDQFRYWLCRKRPEGIKGPRKDFVDIDWWMLRFDPLNAKPISVRNVERKAKELADTIHLQSAEGRAAWHKRYDAYQETRKDEKWQAFKALIPGVNRPKGGRRPKLVEQSQGASA